jgi:hypothetical protein
VTLLLGVGPFLTSTAMQFIGLPSAQCPVTAPHHVRSVVCAVMPDPRPPPSHTLAPHARPHTSVQAVFVGNGLVAILAGLVASYLVDTMKVR